MHDLCRAWSRRAGVQGAAIGLSHAELRHTGSHSVGLKGGAISLSCTGLRGGVVDLSHAGLRHADSHGAAVTSNPSRPR
jgi:hypothetical protein